MTLVALAPGRACEAFAAAWPFGARPRDRRPDPDWCDATAARLAGGRATLFVDARGASGAPGAADLAVLRLRSAREVLIELVVGARPGAIARHLPSLDALARASGADRLVARAASPARARLFAAHGFAARGDDLVERVVGTPR